jgi:hypothetical protein
LTRFNILGLAIADFGADIATMGAGAILAITIATNSVIPNGYYAVFMLIFAMPFRYFKRWYEQSCKTD